MKTKPHGFVLPAKLNQPEAHSYTLVLHKSADYFTEGVCLVEPEVCDKVREFIRDIAEARILCASNQAAELLKLLPEVE